MIKINEIKEEKVYLYNTNDDLIGIITSELQFGKHTVVEVVV